VKRFFLYALLALGAGTALALFLQEDPGYLLLSFRGWQLETTLASIVLALLVLLITVIGVVWLLRLCNPLKLLRGSTWQQWFRRVSPQQASVEGLQLLLLGRWQEAYRLLVENAAQVQNPVFNYVAAAIAAQELGDALGYNFCLDRAEKQAGTAVHGLRSLRALLERRAGHVDAALSQFLAVKRLMPAAPLVLRQLQELQLQLKDWDSLAALLPELEKYKVLEPGLWKALRNTVLEQRLEAAAADSLPALRHAWQELPKPLRHEEPLLLVYLEALLAHNEDVEVHALLKQQFKQQWSDNLVGLLGFMRGGSTRQLLLLLEDQLKQRPNNAVLMLTLGRLSLREKQWGKGREYFEYALRATRIPALRAEIAAELARLLDHLGEAEASLSCYDQAMGMLQHQLPELPMPPRRR
jgi:HemY protein